MTQAEKILQKILVTLKDLRAKWAIACWQTGLGPVRNGFPELFGQEIIIHFANKDEKRSFYVLEDGGELYAFIPESERITVESNILAGPIVQIWTSSGWYSAEARLLGKDETDAMLAGLTADELYGRIPAEIRAYRDGRAEKIGAENAFFTDDPIRRVVGLRRIAACTGEQGPGQYAWVWAALSAVLLLRSVFRKR